MNIITPEGEQLINTNYCNANTYGNLYYRRKGLEVVLWRDEASDDALIASARSRSPNRADTRNHQS